MKQRILAAFLLMAGFARAQAPDCSIQFLFPNGNGTVDLDNRSCAAQFWLVSYDSDSTVTGFTLIFKYSTGVNTPGGFISYGGNTANSSSSFGTAQTGEANYCNLATCVTSAGVTINTPWVQVSSSGGSGFGAIRGTAQGWRAGFAEGAGGSSGGGGSGCPNPCPVVGTGTAGSQTGGVLTIQGDPSGTPVPVTTTSIPSRATFASGQQAVTGSAVALPGHATSSVCVNSLVTSTQEVYAGATGVTTGTGFQLSPGQGACWSIANSNLVFVIAPTTGATVSFTY
jgi:hypothetical protein